MPKVMAEYTVKEFFEFSRFGMPMQSFFNIFFIYIYIYIFFLIIIIIILYLYCSCVLFFS